MVSSASVRRIPAAAAPRSSRLLALRRALGLLAALALVLAPAWGCAAAQTAAAPLPSAATAPAAASTVVLVSLDGTRPADLRSETLPTLVRLAERGARAEALIPVFPTNTFPNHVSLATGVAPERHGIVNNFFIDPERGPFDRDAIPSFLQAEPLWSILDRRGIVTASYYWVGSEGPWKNGHGPRHWHPFSSRTSEAEKVEEILRWLALEDPEERPRLVTTWFHGGDHAGHRHGPGSEAVEEALREQDPAIARLVEGLRELGLEGSTTLIFVSDHGMAPRGRDADLRGALEEAGVAARVIGAGGFAQVHLEAPERDAGRVLAVARELGLEAWRREQAPSDLRVAHPRFGDVVVVAPEGATIRPGRMLWRLEHGFHGHRPELPSMHGLLVAAGPGIAPGTRLGRVSSLDVAPTVLALLGVDPPASMEGSVIEELLPGPDARDAPPTGEAAP